MLLFGSGQLGNKQPPPTYTKCFLGVISTCECRQISAYLYGMSCTQTCYTTTTSLNTWLGFLNSHCLWRKHVYQCRDPYSQDFWLFISYFHIKSKENAFAYVYACGEVFIHMSIHVNIEVRRQLWLFLLWSYSHYYWDRVSLVSNSPIRLYCLDRYSRNLPIPPAE